MSRCHGSKNVRKSTNRGHVNMAEKKRNKKIEMSEFYVHDSTQEQNGSPLFDSIL